MSEYGAPSDAVYLSVVPDTSSHVEPLRTPDAATSAGSITSSASAGMATSGLQVEAIRAEEEEFFLCVVSVTSTYCFLYCIKEKMKVYQK